MLCRPTLISRIPKILGSASIRNTAATALSRRVSHKATTSPPVRASSTAMATEAQKNLEVKNAEYAKTFDKAELSIPPVKQYLVGKYTPHADALLWGCCSATAIADLGRPL